MDNKEIVKLVIEAFLKQDVETALSHMTEDVKIGWPGFFDLEPGKDAIRKFFNDVPKILSGNIVELIAEGNKVAGTGTVAAEHTDGRVAKSFFCDVYELENEKVKEIKSYMIFEQPQPKEK